MKQVIQNLKTGIIVTQEVPRPQVSHGHFLIESRVSLISKGTEGMLVKFGRANFLEKARSQPDKVSQVLSKARTDGILSTFETVQSRLDQPQPLGYCNVGTVLESRISDTSTELTINDRVASNGSHAEFVSVPKNLCARIPDQVSDEEAAFTVLGAVALQGIRLSAPTLGESFAVIGLGLIGQLTVQILLANGCKVMGIDLDSRKCELARKTGAETITATNSQDVIAMAEDFSRGRGLDGVIIAASTKSSDPIHLAAELCRKRGRIIQVGSTGLNLRRDMFYKKEIIFQVSCSYGPGRYDPDYEAKGNDYPLGFVRWTQQRNFDAVLDLMSKGRLDVKPFISHRFPFEDAAKAYDLIENDNDWSLGILLQYDGSKADKGTTIRLMPTSPSPITSVTHRAIYPHKEAVIGFLGAGNFAKQVLLPALKKTNARLKTIVSRGGISAIHLGKKYGFEISATDPATVFSDPEINTIFVATRHDSHAHFVSSALKKGKHVFVEKPLCITSNELDELIKISRDSHDNVSADPKSRPMVMVGFNRRFAPHILKIKELLNTVIEPKSFIMTINAGMIPQDSWVHQPEIGGGRIIGEVCHWVDLLRFLAGCPISGFQSIGETGRSQSALTFDKATFSLSFTDGSFGTIHYLANGNKSFPKERLEVFCQGRILQLDNFRVLRGFGWPGFKKTSLWRLNKGHANEISIFIEAVLAGNSPPIPFDQIIEVTKFTLEMDQQLRSQVRG